jgi:U3 small nucleolar RNA-associated protein 25
LLNHVLTARGRVQRNNKKAKEAEENEEKGGGEPIDGEKLRDQGFTRPCVLILLPTRGTCHTFLKKMLALLGDAAYVDKMDRFEIEYGPPVIDEGDDDTNGEKLRRRKTVIEAKGSDWQELFGDDTNDDDDFKIGINITPRAAGVSKKKGQAEGGVSVKLYSDFYRSDIIIASPIGLKMSTEATDDEEPDIDFLSSIEICLVSRSDILLMQNWDHVNAVLDRLNKQPKKNNDTDFSRVRNYLLAGQAEHWRQLIVTSSFSDPHILSTFKRYAKSIGGQLKLRRRTPVEDASLCNVLVRAKQVFQRISCNSFVTQGTDRLRLFEERILPQIRRQKQKHTMIFIPSYFDFVSVRNLLMKKEVDFVSVTEYARVSEVSRGRARFLQGSKPLLLYTGRAHFFSRHTIKGVRHLILYGLPEHGEFYSGLVNMLNAGLDQESYMQGSTSCLALFTKFDALALERIVGNEHCNRMIKGDKSSFMFCS